MQQVLVDHARKRNASKRGGDRKREAMDIVLDQFEEEHGVDFTELEQALEKLKQHSERQYQVVSLRFFFRTLNCRHGGNHGVLKVDGRKRLAMGSSQTFCLAE